VLAALKKQLLLQSLLAVTQKLLVLPHFQTTVVLLPVVRH
jgi:hypothetical protein